MRDRQRQQGVISLPSPDEIAREQNAIDELNTKNGWKAQRTYLTMICDLAGNAEFMAKIQNDEFAAQVRLFLLHCFDLRHLPTDTEVEASRDDWGAWMLSVLRRYGEHWMECEFNGTVPVPEITADIETMLLQSGYKNYPFMPTLS